MYNVTYEKAGGFMNLITSLKIEEDLTIYLLVLKITPNLKGYDLIKEGVKIILQDLSKKHHVNQRLYFELANSFDFDMDLVDKAMRNAIDVSYKRGGICDFEKSFHIDFSSQKPTPRELICILSEKIVLDLNNLKKRPKVNEYKNMKA